MDTVNAKIKYLPFCVPEDHNTYLKKKKTEVKKKKVYLKIKGR